MPIRYIVLVEDGEYAVSKGLDVRLAASSDQVVQVSEGFSS